MSGIELTLTTLRRTHLGLIVVALGLLILALVRGQDYDLAQREVAVVQELLAPRVMDEICAEAAERRFAPIWGQIAGGAFDDPEEAVFAGFTTSITAYCPHPRVSQPLGQIATFLREGLLVDIPQPRDSALVPLLARNSRAVRLGEAFVLWDTELTGRWHDRVALVPLTDDQLAAINSGEDSLDVRLLYSGYVDQERLPESPLPEADATLQAGFDTAFVGLPVSGDVVALRVPGTIHQSRWSTEDIVASDARWEILVGPPDEDGQLPILPDLQPFWSEVSGLPPAEAGVYLESLEIEEQGRIEVMGAVISTRMLGWVGPALLLIFLLYLLMNLQHLARIAREDPDAVRHYPWLGIFGNPLSVVATTLTIVVLPAAPAGLLSLRLWNSNLEAGIWAGAVGLMVVAVGIWTLVVLANVRQSVLE